MRCHACGAVNRRSSSYCGFCGVAFATVCQKCGHENQPKAQFCSACGTVLESPPRDQAVERGTSHPAWGERKQGTVLFADLVGSTQLIAELDPEQAMERLRPSLGIMRAAVRRFGGTVIRSLGDGIMAVFGVPRTQEAHALLACQAAIAMQRAFESDGDAIKVRVGLHSGELVVSQDEDRPEPVPHGATIHLANRLEQMAEPGAICLTGDCYRLIKLHCDARALGPRTAKGFSKPVETYALLGVKPAVASQQFRAMNLTPFQGRVEDLRQLQRALQRSESGDAQVVGISGAAGTGKSRLCYEFAEWSRRRFIPVLEARALVSKQATPLQPVLEFLRLFLELSSSEDQAAARDRVQRHPTVAGLDAATDIPLLCQFLGIDDPEVEVPLRTQRTRQSRLREILGHMVRQRGEQPYIILIEDLHWLDSGSAEFVGAIVRAIAGTKAMLVVNFRRSYTADWMAQPHYEEIQLDELDAGPTSALVEQLVGDHAELRAVKARIVERCGGNPFFAEELVQSLAERGVIRGEKGDYRLGPRSEEDLLPASVQAIIGARIDALAPPEKNAIHIAAIIGKEFPLSIIEEVAGMPREEIETIIDRLHQAQLIEPRFGSSDQEYFFRHPLIQDVAYNEQLKSRRSELHAAVAVALIRQYSAKLDEFAALIAHHYEAAGEPARAAIYAARAAVWIGSAASAQALQHWHRVLRLLDDQPHTVMHDTLRMRASGQIAMFGWREGMTAEEARPYIDAALVWARKIDNSMTSLLLAADGRIAVASGYSADDYIAGIQEALTIEGDQGNPGRLATLNALFCHANFLAGYLTEALEANDRALQGVRAIDPFDEEFLGLDVEQWMQSLRGRILVRRGQFDDAEACLQKVLAIETSLLDPAVQFIPHLAFVDLACFRDDAELAREHASRIVQIAEKGQNPYLQVYALGCSGAALFAEKDFDGAASKLTEGVTFAQSAKAALEFEPEMMASLADCHYGAGAFGQAVSVAKQAIELAQRRGARMAECRASIIYSAALVAAQGERPKKALPLKFDQAEKLIEMTGASVFSKRLTRERALTLRKLNPCGAQEE
ncbi:MAG: adenylate/guanylate cyclase domain-containing protein [Kiloniellales bacterium]|nr:adenylate/guanylate cyclase domain-containing protein [Kiloniellales bacterium]